MACAGEVPTQETLAAVDLLRAALPQLKIRVVNVVDLMTLQSHSEHPHGFTDDTFDALFTRDRPVIFAYHGYPYLIHRLTHRRANHDNMHVHGFREEGTTTTPFDMVCLNQADRFHLAIAALRRLPQLAGKADAVIAMLEEKLARHHAYIREHGEDMPEIRDWRWGGQARPQEAISNLPLRRRASDIGDPLARPR
jgi:xylulose-5-phosphate/fructose-6-phosphate phosphoketolase